MLKASFFHLCALLLLCASPLSPAWAQTALESAPPAAVVLPDQSRLPLEDPYTVSEVLIDKTAKNAVIAREEAIVEAQRVAFQKLAQRNMTPEEFKNFTLPEDKIIASVVQDFEIKNEQLSFTRYAANFTVRFRDGVRNYINIKLPEAVIAEGGAGLMELAPSKFVLVLPYFENITGKTLLWEDPNPWRRMWQSGAAKQDEGGRQFFVPLGDITDISAGPSDAVWSGDYSVVEKLRASYDADEVILAVANRSGTLLTIDLYSWKDGDFERKETLTPFIRELLSEEDAYKIGVMEVLKSLQKKILVPRPVETVMAISRELTGADGDSPEVAAIQVIESVQEIEAGEEERTTAGGTSRPPLLSRPPVAVPALAGPLMEVDATMSFTSFSTWIEMQKRLSSVVPPVKVNIRSISKGGASFTMKFPGTVDILQKMLAEQGIALRRPAVEVDPSAPGGTTPAGAIYDLQLVDNP